MDLSLLDFSNRLLAHPWLDVLMVGLTTVGIASLPLFGVLLWVRGREEVGRAVLLAQAVGGLATLIFYYLAMRPRPVEVRLLLPTPNLPSYPSGHTVIAFATAAVLILTWRRWVWVLPALVGAGLIGFSRIYLGHHYPSDVAAGMILGLGIGAGCYGVLRHDASGRRELRWLLWPQVALVSIVSQMAYLDILPLSLLSWPLADKVLHFLLFGAITFWLALWLDDRGLRIGRRSLPLAIVLPLAVALVEEGFQHFSPVRTVDLADVSSDLLGMVCFYWLSIRYLRRTPSRRVGLTGEDSAPAE